jgi:hypothetical protein
MAQSVIPADRRESRDPKSLLFDWTPDRARFTRLSGMACLKSCASCHPGRPKGKPGSSFPYDWIPDRARFTHASGMTSKRATPGVFGVGVFSIVIPADRRESRDPESLLFDWIPDRARFTRLSGMTLLRTCASCDPGRPEGEPGSRVFSFDWIPDRPRHHFGFLLLSASPNHEPK